MSETELEHAINLHRQGQFEEACVTYRKLTKSDPDLAEPWHLLGVVQLQSGHPDLAEPFFKKTLEREPDHVKCLTNLGGALCELERFNEAKTVLEKALSLDPSYINAQFNLGNVLMGLELDQSALRQFDDVLKIEPNHVKALLNASVVLAKKHLNDKAKRYLDKMLKLDPENFKGLLQLSVILERQNSLSRAQKCINKALAQQPDNPDANLFGAIIDLRYQQTGKALARLKPLIEREEDDLLKIETLYVYARALESAQRSDEAFAAYEKANALEHADALRHRIDPSKFQAIVNFAHDRLDEGPLVLSTQTSTQTSEQNLIFFVGFPRSGTTLFEQMLSKHPGVVTTNEESPLEKIAGHVELSVSFNELGEVTLERLRTQFWREAESITGGVGHRLLIDKMPLNIHLLDLGLRLFPRARVVTALRDPRDVCLSNFMQNFAQTHALANFLTLENTAWVYDRIMSLWVRQKEELPMSWIEFRYEDLVKDMEGTVSPVLDFMGLDWVDEIKNYQDRAQEGHIVTPSYSQIGEKLHTRASGRWRRYKKHLAPIEGVLAPYIKAFGYND